jgi:hypothetical protein
MNIQSFIKSQYFIAFKVIRGRQAGTHGQYGIIFPYENKENRLKL